MFENLKKFRESTGMKQREFSKQLDMSFQTYNGYERGIREPKSDFWILVSTKYGVSIDYLMGRTDDPTPVDTKKAPPSEDEDADRMQLIENYDSMNRAGKKELLKLSRLLSSSPEYDLCAQYGVGKGDEGVTA